MPFTFAPMPHEEAVKRTLDLPLVTRQVMEGLLPELKAYAFCITGIDAFDQLSRVRDLIAAVPRGADGGLTWDKAKQEIASELESALGGDEAERRSELLLRTHTFRGYAASRYRSLMAQTDVFPYWQYKTHGDGKVRPSHAALNGKIFPAGHPIWQKIFPPWDWGCRCLVVPLMEADVAGVNEVAPWDPDLLQKIDEHRIMSEQDVLEASRRDDPTLLETQQYKAYRYTAEEADAMDKAERLYLPNGQTVSLMPSQTWGSSPWSEKGTVRHTWEMIQQRYAHDTAVLVAFEEWAAQAEVSVDLTVSEWLSGPSLPAAAAGAKKGLVNATEVAGAGTVKTAPAWRKPLDKKLDAIQAALDANEAEAVSLLTSKLSGTKIRAAKAKLAKEKAKLLEKARAALALPPKQRCAITLSRIDPELDAAKLEEAREFIQRVVHHDLMPPVMEAQWNGHDEGGHYTSPAYGTNWTGLNVGRQIAAKTFVHEFGHAIEDTHVPSLDRSVAMLTKRRAGEPLKQASNSIYPGDQSFDDEWTERGGINYAGIIRYHQGEPIHTEAVTMGLERLFTDPLEFRRTDPDHFNFTLAIARKRKP